VSLRVLLTSQNLNLDDPLSSSSADLGCIKCNVKAMQGELHFLDKSMLFVAKTPILVDYNKITKASISR
jgi:hypothetical protein